MMMKVLAVEEVDGKMSNQFNITVTGSADGEDNLIITAQASDEIGSHKENSLGIPIAVETEEEDYVVWHLCRKLFKLE